MAKTTRKPSRFALTRSRNAARRQAQRRKTPLGRLTEDGASSAENIRRRLEWLAREWQIPVDQLPKVKCAPTEELSDFVQRHNINWDWLLWGDLKGLRDMMWARKGVRSLSPDRQIEDLVNRILDERGFPPPVA